MVTDTVNDSQFDVVERLLEPEVLADPGPFYAWLRDNLPVHRHPRGFYVLSRYRDTRWMFETPLLRGPELADYGKRYPRLAQYRSVQRMLRVVSNSNPPDHTRLRRLLSRGFTSKRVEALRAMVERACDRVLDTAERPLRDGEVVDIHSAVVTPFSLQVVAGMLGVPAADSPELMPLVVRALHCANPAATDAMLADADVANAQLERYFEELIAERRATPRDDLVSVLTGVHDGDPDQLSDDELITAIWALWAAGFETSGSAIENAIVTLLRHPDQARWLHAGRPSLRAFIEEAHRYAAPNLLTGITRIAAEDLRVGGVDIPAGSDVRALPGCSNRDPDAFERPEQFDPSRTDAGNLLTFGHGIHYCIGANLARLEMEVMLRRLHGRFPDLVFAAPPVYRRSLPLRLTEHFPVALAGKR
jgi:cytochrome P450 family 114